MHKNVFVETLNKPEKFFVIFALVVGLALMFYTPPMMSADETAHFARAVAILKGNVTAQKQDNMSGSVIPSSVKDFEYHFGDLFHNTRTRTNFEQIKDSAKIQFDENKVKFTDCSYQSMYSPVAYLPQMVGITLTKIFSDSVYWLLIGAKVCQLFFYVILGYLAIKSMPFLKQAALLVLLMPMSLSVGASVSADGVLISVFALYFSLILKYTFGEDKIIKNKQTLLLAVLAVILGLVKQSFLPVLFCLFIPKNKFENKYILRQLAIILPSFAFSVIWGLLCADVLVYKNGAVPALQALFILKHPFLYLHTLLETFKVYFFVIIFSLVGILGWMDVFLIPLTYWLYLFTLVLNIFVSDVFKYSAKFNLRYKLMLLLYILFNIIFTASMIYLSWVPPNYAGAFSGLCGRYFIPLLIPFMYSLSLFCNYKVKESLSDKISVFNMIVLLLTWANVFFAVFIRYYAEF